MPTYPRADEQLWTGVDDLVAMLVSDDAVSVHGMAAVKAGRAIADVGGPGSPRLAVEHLLARRRYDETLEALSAIVAATDERIVLYKGLEVAQRYPDPTQRPFADLDLIAGSPEAVRDDLAGLGYREIPDIVPDGHHHLAPMVLADGTAPVEIHRHPGWLSWMDEPGPAALLERAVPATTPVDGLFTLDPVDHCLCIAVHHWADGPFRRARDLLDLAVMRAGLDETAVEQRADDWGVGRMWALANRCVDEVFFAGRTTPVTKLLTGHIRRGRIRGPVTHRLSVYGPDFLVASPWRAVGAVAHKVRHSDVVVKGRPAEVNRFTP